MIRYHPQQICPAVTWQQPCIRFYYLLLQMEMQWIMRAQTILHPSQICREMMLQQIPEIQAVHQMEHLRIMISRYIRILQQMDSVTERRMILIPGKMICRNYHQRQRRHWMIIPHILIPITEKVIRISLMVTSRFIRNWMQILFRLQEVAQRTIHMYICAAVQKKK